MTSLFIAAHR